MVYLGFSLLAGDVRGVHIRFLVCKIFFYVLCDIISHR